jgi:hypothetical protein
LQAPSVQPFAEGLERRQKGAILRRNSDKKIAPLIAERGKSVFQSGDETSGSSQLVPQRIGASWSPFNLQGIRDFCANLFCNSVGMSFFKRYFQEFVMPGFSTTLVQLSCSSLKQ